MANVGSAASGKTLIGAGNGASPTYASIGTNSGLTNHGVIIGQNNAAFVATGTGSVGQVLTSNGAAADPSFQNNSATDYHVARYIVSAGGAADGANYTTITSAITAAVAAGGRQTIFIQPGTYTENFDWPASINLTAFTCDSMASDFVNSNYVTNVTINGKVTVTSTTGSQSMSGIKLQTNSDYALVLSGAGATVNLINCYISALNNTAIQVSGAGSKLILYSCSGNIETTGIAYFTQSVGSTIDLYYGTFSNSGGSTTASTATAGNVYFYGVGFFLNSITLTTASINIEDSTLITTSTLLTLTTSGTAVIQNSSFESGTASSISIGAGCTATVISCNVKSSNANVITGAGTLIFGNICFGGSSATINTTTQTATTSQRLGISGTSGQLLQSAGNSANPAYTTATYPSTAGTSGNVLTSNGTNWASSAIAATSTFTPVLAFGGASVGITYTRQVGKYYTIGSMVFFNISIILSAKGSSTGAATITGLPLTSANDNVVHSLSLTPVTLTGTATYLEFGAYLNPNATTIVLWQIAGSTGGFASLADTNFAASTQIFISGQYWTA